MKILKKGKKIYGQGGVIKPGQVIPGHVRKCLEADKKHPIKFADLEEEQKKETVKNESPGASGNRPGRDAGG